MACEVVFYLKFGIYTLYQFTVGNSFSDPVSPVWVYGSATGLAVLALCALFLEKKRRSI
jgi:hypothetical protein